MQFKRLLQYKNITHCYTLKENLNFRGVSPIKQESIKSICNELNLDSSKFIMAEQDHTKNIAIINNGNESLEDIDGLITNQKGFVLASKSADCTSLLMYDPEKNAIASVHSGWRGTAKKIAVETVNKMKETYGSKPENIICCICPSIRKCHFEVDEDVKELFENTFKYEGIIEKGRTDGEKQKYNIDTTKINKQMLKDCGLKEENIVEEQISAEPQQITEPEPQQQYFEQTRVEVKPSLWQRFKNSKFVRAISYIMKIKVVIQTPEALPEGRGENR